MVSRQHANQAVGTVHHASNGPLTSTRIILNANMLVALGSSRYCKMNTRKHNVGEITKELRENLSTVASSYYMPSTNLTSDAHCSI
jgi:hypothetical protein